MTRENRNIEINIPGGISNDQVLTFRGQGEAGRNGGPAGDMQILIQVENHKLLKREGYDVYVDPRRPLANQGLRQYTLEIIALLHLKYWCQDEERKKELYNKMRENQLKIEGKLEEQYGIEGLFSTENVVSIKSQDDFSKPKVVTRYSQIAENNSDVKDYSDVIGTEDQIESNDETKEENVNEVNEEKNSELTSVKEKENIFAKIKKLIRKIFRRDRSVE